MKSSNFNNYDFDFGLGSGSSNNKSQPLNGQQKSSSSSYTYHSNLNSSAQPKPNPVYNPNKPAWTHQPLPSQTVQSNPSSMVGDIFGKSWGTSTTASTTSIGIPEKNPNLFGDLLGSALGSQKSNVPLKNAAPVQNNNNKSNVYSMGNLSGSLPKGTAKVGVNSGINNGGVKTGSLGGMAMKNGGGSGNNKDPFGSLLNFGGKKETPINVAAPKNVSGGNEDYSFGDFKSAGKSTAVPPSQPKGSSGGVSGLNTGNFGDFDFPTQSFPSQTKADATVQPKGVDPLDMLFSKSTSAAPGGSSSQKQPFSEVDGWGDMGTDFGGDDGGTTTELEGLPPPPAGVSASTATNKGLDSLKQGQHADAIKWLSWAVVLLERAGNSSEIMEVLSSRASCYKEVGEYKKAVADCTKVLEHDPKNVAILVQRALLYESTEKYKLGAEDLRAVLKIDPGNRLARSTVHRLTQMAG
ncbi:hypothetical protein MKW94_028935 [Papaver nudicaule]|uniref:Uncharacterized protein n=1 Tax=Papaver nudicaule TaxID=74823 RepID=A0AA41SHH6_PAPNU|nr:hypothetical protein [Papaver nudicaule]